MSNSTLLRSFYDMPKSENKMPVLFLGHGSPMNAIEDNEFVRNLQNIGKNLKAPKALLVVSAHWETKGVFVTAMEKPKTIHDFYGFPKALFDIIYAAPGDPDLAKYIIDKYEDLHIQADHDWGFDHGSWSVVKHLFPDANIPMLELSLDRNKTPEDHYNFAKQLSELREKGVLIIGSGNLIHNLRMIDWPNMSKDNYGYDWAIEADYRIKKAISNNEYNYLFNIQDKGQAMRLAIPSPEHYLPLLYTLALKDEDESIQYFNDKFIGGSLSMTSFQIG